MFKYDSWIYGAGLLAGIILVALILILVALLGLAMLGVGIIGFIAMPWDRLTLPVTTEWLAWRSLINACVQFAVSLVLVILGGTIIGETIHGWLHRKEG